MFELLSVSRSFLSHTVGAASLAAAILIGSVGLADEAAAQSGKRAKSPPPEPVTKAEMVATPHQFPVGSLVIVNKERRLYYITGSGEARRYRVAVGNEAERWLGRTFVAAKVVDPKWIPVNGDDPVEGGDPANPLGKRALYLDWSLLRIHGTPSRSSIGSAVSNGCIRMLNEDVVDLFDRVHFGAPVYAINSWADATQYTDRKVAEKNLREPRGTEDRQRRRGRGLFATARRKSPNGPKSVARKLWKRPDLKQNLRARLHSGTG